MFCDSCEGSVSAEYKGFSRGRGWDDVEKGERIGPEPRKTVRGLKLGALRETHSLL
jgi:hypothetical protein